MLLSNQFVVQPKWGFLPRSEFISQETEVKRRVCRYCLHQHLKLKESSISEVSMYCPLDLFSSEAGRIRRGSFILFFSLLFSSLLFSSLLTIIVTH